MLIDFNDLNLSFKRLLNADGVLSGLAQRGLIPLVDHVYDLRISS